MLSSTLDIYVQQYIAPPVIPDYDGLINVFCWAEGQYLGTLPKQMINIGQDLHFFKMLISETVFLNYRFQLILNKTTK